MNEDYFHYMTEGEYHAEAAFQDAKFEADMEGYTTDPAKAWVTSGRDDYYPNPFYRGPEVPHPLADGI